MLLPPCCTTVITVHHQCTTIEEYDNRAPIIRHLVIPIAILQYIQCRQHCSSECCTRSPALQLYCLRTTRFHNNTTHSLLPLNRYSSRILRLGSVTAVVGHLYYNTTARLLQKVLDWSFYVLQDLSTTAATTGLRQCRHCIMKYNYWISTVSKYRHYSTR
eukprot:1272695-Pyramimonas_sp.AAC.1